VSLSEAVSLLFTEVGRPEGFSTREVTIFAIKGKSGAVPSKLVLGCAVKEGSGSCHQGRCWVVPPGHDSVKERV